MVCKKCGNNMNDNSNFCSECGWDLRNGEEIATPVEAGKVMTADSGFGRNKKKILLPGAFALIVILIATIVFAGPVIKNSARRIFESPYEYLLRVQSENTEKFAKDFAARVEAMKNSLDPKDGASAELGVEFGEDFKKLISDESDEETAKMLEWIDSVDVVADMVMDNNGFGYGLKLNANGVEIASADGVMDFNDEALYWQVPALSSEGIKIPFDEAGISPESGLVMLDSAKTMIEIVPDEAVISDLICRYTNAVVSEIKNVTEEKKNITVGEISKKLTVLSGRIDSKTVINISEAVLKEFSADDNIRDIIVDFAEFSGQNGDGLLSELDIAVAEALEEIERAKKEEHGEEFITMNVYVDSVGNIEGIEFSNPDSGEVKLVTLKDGKRFSDEFALKIPGAKVSVGGKGVESGGKINAEYTVYVNDTDVVKVKIENFDIKAYEEGVINCKTVIEPTPKISSVFELADEEVSDDISFISDMRIDVTFSAKSVSDADMLIEVYYKNKMFVAFDIKGESSSDYAMVKPESSIDSTNIQLWVESIKTDKIKKLLEKAGAGKELLERIKTAD